MFEIFNPGYASLYLD